jgi:hypothetical protein
MEVIVDGFTVAEGHTAIRWLQRFSIQDIITMLAIRRTPMGSRMSAAQAERLANAVNAAITAGVPVQTSTR